MVDKQRSPKENSLKYFYRTLVLFNNSGRFTSEKCLDYSKAAYTHITKCKNIMDIDKIDSCPSLRNSPTIVGLAELFKAMEMEFSVKSYYDAVLEENHRDMIQKLFTALLPLFEVGFSEETKKKAVFLYPYDGNLEQCIFNSLYKLNHGKVEIKSIRNFMDWPILREEIPLTKFLELVKDKEIIKENVLQHKIQ